MDMAVTWPDLRPHKTILRNRNTLKLYVVDTVGPRGVALIAIQARSRRVASLAAIHNPEVWEIMYL